MTIEGECADCEVYMVPVDDKECIPKECDLYHIVTVEGKCKLCKGSTKPDALQRRCIQE